MLLTPALAVQTTYAVVHPMSAGFAAREIRMQGVEPMTDART